MSLYALQPTIPHLTRSSLHRCLKRHGISRLLQVEDESSAKRKFKAYPIGYFHIDIAELRTAEGKLYLFVAIDRTSKFAFVALHEKADRPTAVRFHRFDQICRANDIEHRLTKPNYPWTTMRLNTLYVGTCNFLRVCG